MVTSAPGGSADFLLRRQKNRPDLPGLNKCTLLFFLACLCLLTQAGLTWAQPFPDLPRDKLINSEDITKGFEQGQERVKVIVNLAEPAETKAKTDWHSKHSLKLLQDEIRAIQTPVLSALSEGEFKLRYRFDNQAGFSGEVTLQGLEKLKNDPRVISVEPVYLLEPHLRQGIPLMHADTYRSSYNGEGVAIAICDTGIDYRHSMLGNGGFPNGKVIGGYDCGDSDADPMPDSSQAHGTCCAGIAAGDLGDVGDYIGGAAYNAKLYALKITAGSSGNATSPAMVAAWDWCVTHHNDDPTHPILAISTSFGGGRYYSTCDSYSPSMTQAANNAVAAGITILASSGNDGYCDSIAWPACISSVISVGAVYDAAFGTYLPCVNAASCATKYSGGCSTGYYAIDYTAADMVTSYSNTVSFLTVLSPSNRCYTTDIIGSGGYSSGDYDTTFGGTSAACPYTAGAVACLQSAAKSIRGSYLSPSEVRTILTSTGDSITDGKVAITKPRINLERAISYLLNGSPPTANSINVTTPSNTAITIALQATDDGLPIPPGDLNYIITSLPSHGTLSDPNGGGIGAVPYTLIGSGNQVIYTPTTGYSGPDSFQYKANDGGVPPDGGDSNTATVSISIIDTIYIANMDTNPGWTLDSLWQWGTPTGSGGQYGNHDPTAGYTGAKVVGYNLAGDYENSITSTRWAKTPAINCTNRTGVTLMFYRWLNVEQSQYDHAYIQVSNNGSTWSTIWQNSSEITDSSWTLQTFDISAIADNQPTVYIRWGMGTTDSSWQYSGWNIDDVNVTGIVAPPIVRTLNISSTLGGHTEPNEGTHQYSDGSVVDINAISEPNYHFVNWTGDTDTIADVNAAVTTITMDANYTIQANFAIDQRTLTVSSTAGGTVTQPGIGDFNYPDGNVVDINATPDAGYHFVNWTGDTNRIADVNAAVTTITMDANYTIQANFALTVIAPYITSTPVTTAIVGQPYTYDVNATGTPEPNYALITSPAGMTIDPVSGLIQWTPDANQIGDVNVTVETNNIAGSDSQTFTITVSDGVILIYGHVLEADGNTPVEGVLISTEYNDINALTDANGYYELLVDYNWSGIVTPQREGYVFEPNSSTYVNVTQDYNDVNYTATLMTFKIAGYVLESDYVTPISDVCVCAENGGGSWTSKYGGGTSLTDVNGYYQVLVDYNWSGKITPAKYAYAFEPNSRYYADVNEDYIAGQDYNGTLLTFKIAGYVKNECNVPIQGVLVDADGGGGEAATDANGFYEVWVDYAWSGTVTPGKQHCTFDPNFISYVDVLADRYDQNYVADNIYDLDCDGSIGLGDLAVMADNWLSTDPGVPGDLIAYGIVDFLDFADFGLIWQDK